MSKGTKKMGRPLSERTEERIVENTERFADAEVACPLCGEPVPVRVDRKGKPYFTCNECGLQAFVRRDQGIDVLAEMVDEGEELGRANPTPTSRRTQTPADPPRRVPLPHAFGRAARRKVS